ncbi:MAG TPA: RsmE family RNA methyltransferase [Candidatus Angelobacter sp.]
MTRRRWIADRVAGNRAWLTDNNAEHLTRVLRAKPGQKFDIAVEGVVREGTVTTVSTDQVEFELGATIQPSPLPEISVLLSIYKFDRLEWAIEKLTELGVARIFPVISRRTEAHLAKAAEKRVERWRKIALEAAQQSRRTEPLEIVSPVKLKEAITTTKGCGIVLDEGEEDSSLKGTLRECKPPLWLALGPEGGWIPEEIELFRQNGWKTASLGGTILRAETAAIAAAAVAMAELE